jgi:anthranilate phosphoribosyltransferase
MNALIEPGVVDGLHDLSPVLRTLGRGAGQPPEERRGLSHEEAAACLRALLDGRVSEAQLGAWWLASRLHGESPSELAGYLEAATGTLAWQLPAAAFADGRPLWCLPAYNGARRLLNAVPLLAQALVERGARVLVHGVGHDPGRLTTARLWHALGWPFVHDAEAARAALARTGLAFAPIETLHPRLARLLDWRWRLGVRSAPHTIAKLLAPVAGGWLAVPVTHGEYLTRLARQLSASRARGLVYRGCEGEAHWHPRRAVSVQVCRDGAIDMRAWAGGDSAPVIETVDPEATLGHLEAVLSGREPLPAAIEAQADLMMEITYAAP